MQTGLPVSQSLADAGGGQWMSALVAQQCLLVHQAPQWTPLWSTWEDGSGGLLLDTIMQKDQEDQRRQEQGSPRRSRRRQERRRVSDVEVISDGGAAKRPREVASDPMEDMVDSDTLLLERIMGVTDSDPPQEAQRSPTVFIPAGQAPSSAFSMSTNALQILNVNVKAQISDD